MAGPSDVPPLGGDDFFPIFTFVLASMPAGLVIYWAWNNTLSVIQQAFIMSKNGAKIELWDNIKALFGKKSAPADEPPVAEEVSAKKAPEKGSPEWLLAEIQHIRILPLPHEAADANESDDDEEDEEEKNNHQLLSVGKENKMADEGSLAGLVTFCAGRHCQSVIKRGTIINHFAPPLKNVAASRFSG